MTTQFSFRAGALGQLLTPLVAPQGIRATRAIIDLDAIGANVRALRGAISPTSRLMAVVKADAYGHGAPWVAKAAVDAGAELLGVATVSEGLVLRAHGVETPILILGSIEPDEAAAACQARLEITIASDRVLTAVQNLAASGAVRTPVGIHLKVDTGLRRFGAEPELAIALARRIHGDPRLRFAGVFTHFASADEPSEPFTGEQLLRFERFVAAVQESGAPMPPRHVANSAAILTGRGVDWGIARAGIALYGVPPSNEVGLLSGMRPALSIESRIARLFAIDAGDTVGYNRTYRASVATRGALIPIGYADGYRRSLAGKAWAGLAGERANVLGRISMDQIVIEAPRRLDLKAGDPVQVLGGDPRLAAPSVAEMAEMMDTNAYEVLVSIRQRIPRVIVKDGAVIAVRMHESGDILKTQTTD